MPEPAKVPPGYVYELSAMCVDIEGHARIDPYAVMAFAAGKKNVNPDPPVLLLEKLEDGTIKVDLSKCGVYAWSPGPIPERKHGLEWILVTQFTGQRTPKE
jgi:hypothetical protein